MLLQYNRFAPSFLLGDSTSQLKYLEVPLQSVTRKQKQIKFLKFCVLFSTVYNVQKTINTDTVPQRFKYFHTVYTVAWHMSLKVDISWLDLPPEFTCWKEPHCTNRTSSVDVKHCCFI